MGRTAIWTDIETTLRAEIAEGRFGPGDKLPTEAALADDGVTHSRRGSGVFVLARPTAYRIGERARFSDNLRASGRTPRRGTLRLEIALADAEEAAALGPSPGDSVHVWEGLSFADDAPLSLFHSVFPAARLPGLIGGLTGTGSVTEALRGEGVEDYVRHSTVVTAVAARPAQAWRLKMREGAPLLFATSINAAPDGAPVEYGRSWFAGDRGRLEFGGD